VEQFEFTKPLEDVKVIERENAIFECCVSHKKVPVTWYVAGVEVVPGPKYQVLEDELTHRLAINVARPADEGEVTAVFRDQTSIAKLFVEREYYVLASSRYRLLFLSHIALLRMLNDFYGRPP